MDESYAKEKFADIVQKLLDENGIGRTQLSKELNVPYSTICNWMKGKAFPRLDKLLQLAELLNTTPSELLDFDGKSDDTEIDNSNLRDGIEGKIDALNILIKSHDLAIGELPLNGGSYIIANTEKGQTVDKTALEKLISECEEYLSIQFENQILD